MFDPTIFDNLKVVIEGAVYELDLKGGISIIGRNDLVELATMSRSYALKFTLTGDDRNSAEIRLSAETEDLAGEIMNLDGVKPGCRMILSFNTQVDSPEKDCETLGRMMEETWGDEARIVQRLSYEYGQEVEFIPNEISVDFERKFGEDVIGDLPRLLDHMVLTLRQLSETV